MNKADIAKMLHMPTKGQSTGVFVEVFVGVLIAVTMIPLIKGAIASATNLTATESTLLATVTVFLVLGLVYVVIRKSGLVSGK